MDKKVHFHVNKYSVFSFIVLIVLPLLLILSSLFYASILYFFQDYFNDAYLGAYTVSVLQYAIFVMMIVAYPIYPTLHPMGEYFTKVGPRNAVKEYEHLKKVIYVLMPLFILGIVYIIVRLIGKSYILSATGFFNDPTMLPIFSIIIGVSFFVVAAALLRIILLTTRMDYRYYYAKACMDIVISAEDQVYQIKYLIKGMNSYNAYVRRNIKLQINGLNKIYSAILSDKNIKRDQIINQLYSAFDCNDKLSVIKQLSIISKIKAPDQFLIKEPLGKRAENWAQLVGTILSAAGAVAGALVTFIVPTLNN